MTPPKSFGRPNFSWLSSTIFLNIWGSLTTTTFWDSLVSNWPFVSVPFLNIVQQGEVRHGLILNWIYLTMIYSRRRPGMLAGNFVATRIPKGLKHLIIANSPASIELFEKGTTALLEKFPKEFVTMLRKHEEKGTFQAQEYQVRAHECVPECSHGK